MLLPLRGGKNVTEDDACELAGDGDGDPTGDGDGDGDGDPTGDGDGDGDTLCMGSADCTDPMAPFCDLDSGECVNCGGTADPDGTCAGADPEHPLCVSEVCVACTEDDATVCVETTPICEVETNTCVGCDDHAQCPGSACNLAAGNCFDPGAVLHVDGDTPDCPGADGTEAKPYCDLGDALLDAASETLIVLHEQDIDPYTEANIISASLAIFAADGESPVLVGTGGQAPISVTPSGLLFLRGVTMAGTQNNGVGLAISGGQAWIERAKIVNNTGGGIVVDGGGTLVLENSFVGGNQNQRIIDVIDGQAMLNYSTIGAGFGNGSRAIACADGSGSSVRNSIIVSYSNQPEIECPNAEIITSFSEMDSGMMFDDISGWFADFESGNFHLSGTHPAQIETAATWQTGDPLTDIDGDLRPTTNGSPDFAGADVSP